MRELSLHILDLARNSIEAGATLVEIRVVEDRRADMISVVVRDNGIGMDGETAVRAADAFFTTRTTRRFGLGLALAKAMCEQCGGEFHVDSGVAGGTEVRCTAGLSHIDRPPLGDIGGVVQTLACEAGRVTLRYTHETDEGVFELDTDVLMGEFGDGRALPTKALVRIPEVVLEGLRRIKSCA